MTLTKILYVELNAERLKNPVVVLSNVLFNFQRLKRGETTFWETHFKYIVYSTLHKPHHGELTMEPL